MTYMIIKVLSFSPTGTTKRVLDAIIEGIDVDMDEYYDLTIINESENNHITFGAEDLILIGAPVYSGRLPIQAAHALRHFYGQGSPVVLVCVYGNRAFEDALLEMSDIVIEQGFEPIAAAAYIGEHSFSSDENPIAVGRPDAEDLENASLFGRKLKAIIEGVSRKTILIPGNRPYRERSPKANVSPSTNEKICIQCGICVKVCPTSAISLKESITTDTAKCLLCCACIKSCPVQARYMGVPELHQLASQLSARLIERREPEWFI